MRNVCASGKWMLVVACVLGSAWSARAQGVEWKQLEPIGRAGPVMSYDSARGKTVMFGGATVLGTTYPLDTSETWEWDGAAWNSRGTDGPSARRYAAMVYDSARQVTVLFGGYYLNGSNSVLAISSDTWEWNGTSWTQRAVSGPSARYLHAMAYDSARHVVVLFGGRDGANNPFSDTWEWDGTSWTPRAVAGPDARYQHAMSFDPVRGVTVLNGGYTPFTGSVFGDTWEWNGTAWTRRSPSGSAQYGHSMCFDAVSNATMRFGGVTSGDQTWMWNGSAWTQRMVAGPSAASAIGMAFDSVRHVAVVFDGGMWEWNGSAWAMRQSATPLRRTGLAMCHDLARHRTVLFGGNWNNFDQGDTWEWTGTAWVQRAATGPSARSYASLAYDPVRGVSVLFGGSNSSGTYRNDTWEWDGAAWTQRASAGPSPRSAYAMTYDAARGETVLFGGRFSTISGQTNYGDTWAWNGSAWSPRSVVGPPARWASAMAYDPTRAETVLFGGIAGSSTLEIDLNDTWIWNGTSWSRRRVSGPSIRGRHGMAFDGARGVVVLFGGGTLDVPYGSDTWEWDGAMWSRRPETGPRGRYFTGMTFDSNEGGVVLFGGAIRDVSGGSPVWIDDTWSLAPAAAGCPAPSITLNPASGGIVCKGASEVLGLAGPGSSGAAYQWRRGTPATAIPGEMGSSLTLTNIGAGDFYDCVVTTACGTVTTNAVYLSVCAADFNCSGTVEFADLFDFLSAWFAGDARADFNGSGLSTSDIFDFINAWFVGC